MIYNDLNEYPGRRRRIPVRRPLHNSQFDPRRETPISPADGHQPTRQMPGAGAQQTNENGIPKQSDTLRQATNGANAAVSSGSEVNPPQATAPVANDIDWQAIAQRTRAEMENFRQRQQRRADAAIEAEKARLLKAFLPIADNLQRALEYEDQSDLTLREGVELVLRQLTNTLANEGVTAMETTGQRFDPAHHEAVAITSAAVDTDTIIDELEMGYTLHDKLLRPAKVIVAK